MRFRRHRYPARFPITVQSSFGKARSKISNVNESGARLTAIAGLVRGDAITLILSVGRIQAIVQWVTKDQIGVAFRPHIPLSFVDAMRHGATSKRNLYQNTHGFREMR